MISRAIQRSNSNSQSIINDQIILFDKHVTSWTSLSSLLPITYRSGYFTIPAASNSDYLITWTLSIRTATRLDGMSNLFLLRLNYGNGAVTEGCSSCSITPTGIMNGFKIVHITRTSIADLLTCSLINISYQNTIYLKTFTDDTSPLYGEITNANMCIFSI